MGRPLDAAQPDTNVAGEKLCPRQQLVVLKRHQARPQLRDTARRFWILAHNSLSGWRRSLMVEMKESNKAIKVNMVPDLFFRPGTTAATNS